MSATNIEKVATQHRTIIATRDQVSNDLGDEKIILNMKTGEYYGMNAVGSHVWDMIQESRTVDEVIAALVEKYGIDQERCEHDIMALLKEMSEVGLIEVS